MGLGKRRLGACALALALAAACGAEDAVAPEDFRSVRADWAGGPCPVEGDCVAFLEVGADGRAQLDPWARPGVAAFEVTLSPQELAEVRSLATAPALIEELRRGEVCPPPTDSSTALTLVLEGETLRWRLGCDSPAVQALLGRLWALGDAHAP